MPHGVEEDKAEPLLQFYLSTLFYLLYLATSPPTGLRLDVAGALLTKRVPRFALPSITIFDDSDIEDYL